MTARSVLARHLAGGSAPRFDDAACLGRHALFDPIDFDAGETHEQVAYRHTHAARLCHACPTLRACREWSTALPPSKRPAGVLAGQIPEAKRAGRPRGPQRRPERPRSDDHADR